MPHGGGLIAGLFHRLFRRRKGFPAGNRAEPPVAALHRRMEAERAALAAATDPEARAEAQARIAELQQRLDRQVDALRRYG